MSTIDIRKAGAVLVKDRKFLVTRSYNKDVFVAPGGKLEGSETAKQALIRELNEELQIKVAENQLEELGVFRAAAAGNESKMLEMNVFLVNGTYSEPDPSSEIEEIKWIDTNTTEIKIGSIFKHDIMPILKTKGLIS